MSSDRKLELQSRRPKDPSSIDSLMQQILQAERFDQAYIEKLNFLADAYSTSATPKQKTFVEGLKNRFKNKETLTSTELLLLAKIFNSDQKFYFQLISLAVKCSPPNAYAFLLMGNIFFHGKGVSKDAKNAFTYYERAASLGDIEGNFRVGKMYQEGAVVSLKISKKLLSIFPLFLKQLPVG